MAKPHGPKDFLRAPEGGIRLGGKFFRGGVRVPERYRRQMTGETISKDPANGVPLTAPNMGRMVLPHAITFQGRQGTMSNVYRNPDEAVRNSGGQAWKMRRDPSIMECLEARQRGTALLGWHLEVEDENDPQQKQLKDEMTKVLKRTYQFTEYRRNLLEALWYGRYAVEHKYGFQMIDGKRRCVIEGWTPINGDKLVFRYDDGSGKYKDGEVGVKTTPAFGQRDKLAGDRKIDYTSEGAVYFLEDWERNLLAIHRHIIEDGDYEDPISAGRIHGVGIRDRIYWTWFQKQETMAQMMEVIDRTGSGITIYWYPHGDPKAKEEVEEMAQQQKHENVLVMPRMSGDPSMDAYGIERIEPTTAGIEAMRSILDEFFGDQIMRYICGGTLPFKSRSLGIGGGGADIQEQSFYLIIQYDSVKLEETITAETVTPLKEFNCPWARDIPLWFRIDTDSPDSQEKLQAAKTLWEMGAKIKTAEVMAKVGLSMPTEEDEVLQNPAAMPQQPGMDGMGKPGAEGQPADPLHHDFGPLADLIQGNGQQPPGGDEGGPEGGEPPPSPSEGGGPAKYAKDDAPYGYCPKCGARGVMRERRIDGNDRCENGCEYPSASAVHKPDKYGRKRQIRSSPGQLPLPSLGDKNSKQHHLWREELHPRAAGGQWTEKSGGKALPHQHGQGMLFSEMASKIHETEQYPDSQAAKAKQQDLFSQLASSDIHPEQLKAFLSGDEERMKALQEHALETGQHEPPAEETEMPPGEAAISPGEASSDPWDNTPRKLFGKGMDMKDKAESAGWKFEHDEEGHNGNRPKWYATSPDGQQYVYNGSMTHGGADPWEPIGLSPKDREILPDHLQGINPAFPSEAAKLKEIANKPADEPFNLQQQTSKLGRGLGTEDKSPEISKGKQAAFFHGLNDAPGQNKLFGGMDLGGPAEEPVNQPKPAVHDPITHRTDLDEIAKEAAQSGSNIWEHLKSKGLSSLKDMSVAERRQYAEAVDKHRAALNPPAEPSEARKRAMERSREVNAEPAAETAADRPTKTTADGTVWTRAKAGGEVSPVTGTHFKGGQWMPIHGLSVKGESKPAVKPEVPAGAVPPKPNEDGKGRSPLAPMSPEDIEDERIKRENQAKWSEMAAGPLGKVKWLGDAPNQKAATNYVTNLEQWKDYAKGLGKEGVQRLIDKLEPMAHERIDQATAAAHAKNPNFDAAEHAAWEKNQMKEAAKTTLGYNPRKNAAHEKEVPGSLYARELVQTLLDRGSLPAGHPDSVSHMHEIHRAMQDAGNAPIHPAMDMDSPPEPVVAAPKAEPKLEEPPPVIESTEHEPEGIQDFGEKIGGARKDTAKKLGSRGSKAKEEADKRPAWARRYEVGQIAKSNRPEEEGKWSIHDTRDTNSWGQPRQRGGLYDTKEDAEKALPLLHVSRNHRVYKEPRKQAPNAAHEAAQKLHDEQSSAAADEWLANVSGQMESLQKEYGHVISQSDVTRRLKQALAEGKITPQRFEDLKKSGAVLSDADMAKAEEGQRKIDAVRETHMEVPEAPKPPDGAGGDTYGIYRNVTDRKRALVKGGFKSEEEAMRHMAANPEAVIEHKFPDWEDYSYLEHVERKGKEHRKGDVKTSDFQKAFGFRGGEFGKWQMNKDGQTSLNHAYDGLHDLADALNLPPKAVSLNGELAIGFGSRGTGGKHSAKAHYEPGSSAVINMTKMKGAGSLAHEWFHALDNYVAKQAEGKQDSENLLSNGTLSKHQARPELVDAWKNLVDVMHFNKTTVAIDPRQSDKLIKVQRENLGQKFNGLERRLQDEARYNKRFKPFTPEQQQQWDELRQKIESGDPGKKIYGESKSRMGGYQTFEHLEKMNQLYKAATGRQFHKADRNSDGNDIYWGIKSLQGAHEQLGKANQGETKVQKGHTSYVTEAARLDQTRTGDYYQLPHEMAARAFAAYVQDKVEANGHKSEYLTAKAHNKHYRLIDAKPFPEGEERTAINGAFDQLFAALKHETRSNEKGEHVRLYGKGK